MHMKVESGTCNVCAAPCSSYLHFNQAVSVMGSKAEGGYLKNSYGGKDADLCSFSTVDLQPSYKSRTCNDQMHAAGETSNLFSTTSSHDSFSEKACPQRPTNTYMLRRTFSNHQKDHRGLECHGDSISCVTGFRNENVAASDLHPNLGKKDMPHSSTSTGALLGQGFKMAGQAQVEDGAIQDICSNSRRLGKFTKKPSQKVSSSNSVNAEFPYNASEFLSLNCNQSLKDQCLHSHDDIENSFCTHAVSKDAEETSSFQLRAEPHERSMDPVESSLGGQLTSSAMDGQKSNKVSHARIHPNYENNKANIKKNHDSLVVLKNTYQWSATKTAVDDGNTTYDSMKHGILNQQSGNPNPSLDASIIQGHQPETQPTLESDCADPEALEDDVKVCDICGDVGREDLLAICSRCNDGAEHTYCMRIMVHKVPKGNWLCEECELKGDIVINKVKKSETLLEASKTPCSGEKVQKIGSRFNSKLLPKLDIGASDAEVSLGAKGLKTQQIFAKRLSDNAEITSPSNKKHSETHGASAMTASPSRKPVLSHEISFKNLDAGKVKPVDNAPRSGSEFSNSSQVIPCSLSPSPNLVRSQGQYQLPRGLLSKARSFNSLRPKVKQIVESVPQKPRATKESATNEMKTEGFVRTFSKSASFKNTSSGHLSATKSIVKTQSVNLHQPKESRNLRQGKERIAVERKNSLLSDCTLPSLSAASSIGSSISKPDSTTSQNDGKLNLSEPNTPNPEDRPGKVRQIELKKQASHVPKTSANLPSNGSCNFADQSRHWVAPREANIAIGTVPQHISMHSFNRDEKIMDSSSFGSSQPVVSPSNRVLCCQRCNEVGHSTQFCTIDKLRASASRSSAEHSLRVAANKGNKQKDAADAAISKGRVQKSLPGQSEETSTTHLTCEVVPENQSSSSSSCVKDLTTADGTTGKQNSLRSTAADTSIKTVNDVKQCVRQPMGAMWTSRDGESDALSSSSEELKVNPPMQVMPELDSVLFDPFGVSSLPDHEYMWQGSFEVKKAGRFPELFDGIQAHLSTCASPRVLEVATKFPGKIHLEELPRPSTWPLQFQENSPTEENIALFFFAKDVISYEKSYSSLLENMINNDLALMGNFNGIELLIFPSSKLPVKSQRWNRLFFLWGIFIERTSNCSEPLSGSQSKAGTPKFNVKHMVQDLPIQLVSEVVVSERESPCEDMDKLISRHDKSTNTVASDFSKFSSLGPKGRICYVDGSFGQRNSNQETIESNFLAGTKTSCSVAATDSLTSKSEQSSSHDISPGSRINNSTSLLCLEAKSSSSTCQKEFITASDIGNGVELPVNIQSSCTQIVHGQALDGLSPMHMITSDPEPPNFLVDLQDTQDVSYDSSAKHQQLSLSVPGIGAVISSNVEEKMKNTGRLTERGTASDSDTRVDKTEEIRWESELPNRKRAHLYSPEPVSQFFSETSRDTRAEMLCKERECILFLDEEREEKKIKLHSEAPACGTSGVDSLSKKISSKVQTCLPGFVNEQQHPEKFHSGPTMPENSRDSQRYLFSLDSGSVMDIKSGNLIPLEIVSSDDEDHQEFDVPNLELGLGRDKRAVKLQMLPLFFPSVDENTNQEKSDPATEDGDDESSLSLSLAFPFSG